MAHYFPLFVSHDAASARTSAEPKLGLFHRLFAAIAESRQKAADRAIARYIGAAGFNDSVELEIERRFLSRRSGGL